MMSTLLKVDALVQSSLKSMASNATYPDGWMYNSCFSSPANGNPASAQQQYFKNSRV